jgi:hypothetical protein
VHRVQRIPATEKSGRVHTSTAVVAVLKEPVRAPGQRYGGDVRMTCVFWMPVFRTDYFIDENQKKTFPCSF